MKRALPENKRKETTPRRRNMLLALLTALAVYVLVFLLVTVSATPKRHTLSVDSIAQETITATKDVEDKISTDKLKAQAREGVSTIFKQDHDITVTVGQDAEKYFDSLILIHSASQQLKAAKLTDTAGKPAGTFNWGTELTRVELDNLKAMCSVQMSDDELMLILNAEEADLNVLKAQVLPLMNQALQNGVKEQFLVEAENERKDRAGAPQQSKKHAAAAERQRH